MTDTKTFADLGVSSPLIDALTARGIAEPFPIQQETLPDTLAGRDVLGRGKTGSGKTLAFCLPLVSGSPAASAGRRARRVWSSRRPASWPPRSRRRWHRWPL